MTAQLVLELIKALAWPIVVLVILAAFWRPLRHFVGLLPTLLESSESIQVGSVSLQLRKQFARIVSEDVRHILSELDAADMLDIISTKPGGEIVFSRSGTAPMEDELRYEKYVRLKMATPMSQADLVRKREEAVESGESDAKLGDAGFVLTSLYERVYDFLVNLIPELVGRYGATGTSRKPTAGA